MSRQNRRAFLKHAVTAGAAATFTPPTATDIVDPSPSLACTGAMATYPVGVSEVRCTATDANFNATTIRFTVTVTDTGAPTLTVPANLTIEGDRPSAPSPRRAWPAGAR